MQSNDTYITVEMFNAGISRLEAMNERNMAIIDGKLTEIRSEIHVTNSRIDSTNSRIDNMAERLEDLKFFGSIAFAIITVLLAIMAFKREKTEVRHERSEELSPRNIRDIRALIREEFSMLNSVASR